MGDGGFGVEERQTLRTLCDTLVPRVPGVPDSGGFFGRSATDVQVDEDIVNIVGNYLAPEQQADFHRLLRTVENPLLNLVLTGRPSRFSRLPPEARERYLLGWAHSHLPVKRQGFHAVKRLTEFLFYARLPDGHANPNWPATGYEGPDDAERARHHHPEELRIIPFVPQRETTLRADVCVVGSGAGGGVIAAKLAEAGYKVVVLEAGGYRTPDNFTQREADAYDTMFQGHGVLTTKDLAFGILAGETAGGSTTINWMIALKPPIWARQEWERDAGMEGVTSPAFEAMVDEVWARVHATQEESQINPCNDVLRRGSEALGYREGVDYEILYRNAKGCAQRCDFCFFGCIYNAKQSTLVTYLPDAFHAGARFLFDTKADRITVEGGAATGVEATYRAEGREIPIHVKASQVVAAGSALQTPALLLRSGIRFPGVGVGLRFDPTTALFGEFPGPIRFWKGPMQTVVVKKFQDSDEAHHGPWLEVAPAHPGLTALALPWNGGRAHKELMTGLARSANTIVLTRDWTEGRVTIDARGEPVFDYRLDPRDRRNLTRGLQEAARIHRAAGATRISTLHMEELSAGDGNGPIPQGEFDDFLERLGRASVGPNRLALFTAHPMGSARAGRDPRTSAAKPTGECHEVANLWIGDGSIFPTAPGVNPTISIMSMAMRTAGFIRERLAQTR
ncbi:MAG TPA: GMC family oxidoreductase N-terminal domain-containing protein [Thermoplasmata archaeon]|nr:GMC family oxidoreductase N-terminal domain-containing protein [Thermoplasmata archaeon]